MRTGGTWDPRKTKRGTPSRWSRSRSACWPRRWSPPRTMRSPRLLWRRGEGRERTRQEPRPRNDRGGDAASWRSSCQTNKQFSFLCLSSTAQLRETRGSRAPPPRTRQHAGRRPVRSLARQALAVIFTRFSASSRGRTIRGRARSSAPSLLPRNAVLLFQRRLRFAVHRAPVLPELRGRALVFLQGAREHGRDRPPRKKSARPCAIPPGFTMRARECPSSPVFAAQEVDEYPVSRNPTREDSSPYRQQRVAN